ncbi:MAG: cell filamentation protein Fic [Deltaproteobacteria bacterium]|nr:cell filamentation protein Fic [Deltaproteobacteria bacterium]
MRPVIRQNLIGELVLSQGPGTLANAISEAVNAGELRRLVPSIYTTAVAEDPADVLRRNLYQVLGSLYAGAIISHRSALEAGPAKLKDNWHIVLSYKYDKKVQLPGLTVHLVKGPQALPGDMPFAGGLHLASPERAWLENLRRVKAHGGFSKVLSQEKFEEQLDDYIRVSGENAFREKVNALHRLAETSGFSHEAERFQKLAGTMLKTRSDGILKSDRAQQRATGYPYDPERVVRFEQLFQALRQPASLLKKLSLDTVLCSESAISTLCFFDAYFSNYIEGTRFELEEARAIAFDGKIPDRRPDGHDILGTFRTLMGIASTRPESWTSYGTMAADLMRYHAAIMKAHPDKLPGRFKTVRNFAGSTAFVVPELVEGTLRKGFELFRALEPGFARAAFIKFMVAEVHPFTDGNGRLSRIAMNRELYSTCEVPVIIPTVYRSDYLGGVKKLTRTDNPATYIKMLQRAQCFVASIDYTTFESAQRALAQAKAFSDDPEDVLLF